MNIKYSIWFRTLRFFVYNWSFPFVFGFFVSYLFFLNFAVELSFQIVEACSK